MANMSSRDKCACPVAHDHTKLCIRLAASAATYLMFGGTTLRLNHGEPSSRHWCRQVSENVGAAPNGLPHLHYVGTKLVGVSLSPRVPLLHHQSPDLLDIITIRRIPWPGYEVYPRMASEELLCHPRGVNGGIILNKVKILFLPEDFGCPRNQIFFQNPNIFGRVHPGGGWHEAERPLAVHAPPKSRRHVPTCGILDNVVVLVSG